MTLLSYTWCIIVDHGYNVRDFDMFGNIMTGIGIMITNNKVNGFGFNDSTQCVIVYVLSISMVGLQYTRLTADMYLLWS